MKHLAILLIGFSLLSFISNNSSDYDFNHLYQNWSWARWEAGSRQQFTFKPSFEFGNMYGYQFRKNGTFSICRGFTHIPSGYPEFEVADGTFEITQDSIIAISYISNHRGYEQQLIVRKLTADELIVHFIRGD